MRFPCLSADGEAIGTAQDDDLNLQNVRVVRMKLLELHFYAFFVWKVVPAGQGDTYQEMENRKLSGESGCPSG